MHKKKYNIYIGVALISLIMHVCNMINKLLLFAIKKRQLLMENSLLLYHRGCS